MIILVFVLSSVLLVVAWRRWKRICDYLLLDERTTNALTVLYWCLFATLICSLLGAIAAEGDLVTSTLQRRIVWVIAIGVILQTVAFTFVFTPIAMHATGKKWSFSKTAILSFVSFVPPVTLLIGLGLWLFSCGGSLLESALKR